MKPIRVGPEKELEGREGREAQNLIKQRPLLFSKTDRICGDGGVLRHINSKTEPPVASEKLVAQKAVSKGRASWGVKCPLSVKRALILPYFPILPTDKLWPAAHSVSSFSFFEAVRKRTLGIEVKEKILQQYDKKPPQSQSPSGVLAYYDSIWKPVTQK